MKVSREENEMGDEAKERKKKINKFPIKIFYGFSLHIWHRRGNRFRIKTNNSAWILHCIASVKSEKSTSTIDTITACAPNITTKQIECHIIHVIMCTNPITNGTH